ncbi:hypothetical protein MPSEU_000685600 [Mayamaea pseudoterrestris]|nr:hypothetical protein MPSEU_000685600 [Mayamaea pseudoterrestris]
MNFSIPGVPAIAAVIPGKSPTTCIRYHEEGKTLYVASEGDAQLQVVNCLSGKEENLALRVDREQIHEVEATHHENCVLFAGKGSTMIPSGQRHAVSYWSLHDNKILRKFRGHQDKVNHISMSPCDDTFLTSSVDRTVRLWNLQQAGGIAELKLPSETAKGPLACFDATGLVFAVGALTADLKGHYVHLYDARNYGAGAFAEFKLQQQDVEQAMQAQTGVASSSGSSGSSLGELHSLSFNTSGSQILLGGEHGQTLVLDGFEGTIQKVFSPANRTSDGFLASCFSSDDKTLLQANDAGGILCWDLEHGSLLQTLEGHSSRVNCISSNPRYSQIASSCTQTCLWLW